MNKVLAKIDGDNKEYENFEKFFQELSEKGIVISSVEDGKIITKDKKEIDFFIITAEGSKNKMVDEISKYRDTLREAIVPLMKQKIVTKEQAAKLKEQFAFLDNK